MGKDNVLPMEENRIIDTVPEVEADAEDAVGSEECFPLEGSIFADAVEEKAPDEREQYEALIKNRFKEFYAEDTQRLINRRFRKYKVMEERYRLLEETLAQKEARIVENEQKIAEFDDLLRSEIERAIKETEERVIGEIRSKRLRPLENGAMPSTAPSPFDVSRLTKNDRAALAKRAAGGEKIKF